MDANKYLGMCSLLYILLSHVMPAQLLPSPLHAFVHVAHHLHSSPSYPHHTYTYACMHAFGLCRPRTPWAGGAADSMIRLADIDLVELLMSLPGLVLVTFAALPVHRAWVQTALRPWLRRVVRSQLPVVMKVQDRLRRCDCPKGLQCCCKWCTQCECTGLHACMRLDNTYFTFGLYVGMGGCYR